MYAFVLSREYMSVVFCPRKFGEVIFFITSTGSAQVASLKKRFYTTYCVWKSGIPPGRRPPQSVVRGPVAPLKATAGTLVNRLPVLFRSWFLSLRVFCNKPKMALVVAGKLSGRNGKVVGKTHTRIVDFGSSILWAPQKLRGYRYIVI